MQQRLFSLYTGVKKEVKEEVKGEVKGEVKEVVKGEVKGDNTNVVRSSLIYISMP